jgi:hypothetical protein
MPNKPVKIIPPLNLLPLRPDLFDTFLGRRWYWMPVIRSLPAWKIQLVLELERREFSLKHCQFHPSCISGWLTHPMDQELLAAVSETPFDDLDRLWTGAVVLRCCKHPRR